MRAAFRNVTVCVCVNRVLAVSVAGCVRVLLDGKRSNLSIFETTPQKVLPDVHVRDGSRRTEAVNCRILIDPPSHILITRWQFQKQSGFGMR